jgi:hypothetical protein
MHKPPRNVFVGKLAHTVYNAIASGYALVQREKTAEKVDFFSNFAKLERFLWKLSPIEEYNRKPIRDINIKQHPVILDPQPAHLELVNPPRIMQHFPQHLHRPWLPEHRLTVVDLRGHPIPPFRH